MNRSDYAKLFRLLDGYAKRHHACFLTELFLNDESAEYVACFRPQSLEKNAENQQACRYLRMEIPEVREMIKANLLPVSVAAILDEKLSSLTAR